MSFAMRLLGGEIIAAANSDTRYLYLELLVQQRKSVVVTIKMSRIAPGSNRILVPCRAAKSSPQFPPWHANLIRNFFT
jgi:hypothetical protein